MVKAITLSVLIGFGWALYLTKAAGAKEAHYVGSEACKECHDAQYSSFTANSKKAGSFEKISRMKRKLTDAEFNECLKCHTTGYGRPGGFRSIEETPGLKNPGCEVCHGPGSIHAESGDPADITVKVSLKVCSGCHNPERVAAFGFKPILYSGGH